MTEKESEIIRQFKSLIENLLHVCSMTVFGSRARGDNNPDSDLDVLVVIDESETWDRLMYIYDCAYDLSLENGIIISPSVFSRDRWENSPERSSLLSMAIKKEGILV
jgi:predicted nucleotidyltransferase